MDRIFKETKRACRKRETRGKNSIGVKGLTSGPNFSGYLSFDIFGRRSLMGEKKKRQYKSTDTHIYNTH